MQAEVHIANADLALFEGKYRRAWNQFNKADKLNSDKRSRHGIKKAKKLEDEERERKWDEEYGEEYARSILENGQFWDKWVNGQGKLRDWVLSYEYSKNVSGSSGQSGCDPDETSSTTDKEVEDDENEEV